MTTGRLFTAAKFIRSDGPLAGLAHGLVWTFEDGDVWECGHDHEDRPYVAALMCADREVIRMVRDGEASLDQAAGMAAMALHRLGVRA